MRGLVEAICKNCERLKLWGEIGREPAYLVELTAFGTTLAMNFLTRGTFTGDRRRGNKDDGKRGTVNSKRKTETERGHRAEGRGPAAN